MQITTTTATGLILTPGEYDSHAVHTVQSLPVFTIADANRILIDNEYCTEVIWSLYEYLFDLDGLLGTGRLFIP